MPYRQSCRVIDLPAAEGTLRIGIEPDAIELAVADRRVRIAGRTASVHTPTTAELLRFDRLALATHRCGERSIWIGTEHAMQRVFAVTPTSCADHLWSELRVRFARSCEVMNASELGSGDAPRRALVVESDRALAVFASRMFRSAACLALAVHGDRIRFPHAPPDQLDGMVVDVTRGQLRFRRAAADVARVSLPWLEVTDRHELARRLGAAIERLQPAAEARCSPSAVRG